MVKRRVRDHPPWGHVKAERPVSLSGVTSMMVKPFFSVGLSVSSKLKYRQSDQYHRSRTSDSRSILFLIECGVGKETSPYAFDQEA